MASPTRPAKERWDNSLRMMSRIAECVVQLSTIQ